MCQKQLEWSILQALSERTSSHVIDLADQIEEHPVAVDQACARLHNEGYITPSSHGIYDITTRGQRRIDELEDTS
jgi:Mn-dependent DtxR family transcriptional regulator